MRSGSIARLGISNCIARCGAHGVGVDDVGKNGMADPQISARRLRVAKQEDLAILEFAASGRVCDRGEKIHPLRDDGVVQIGLADFPERERNTKRGRAPSEGLRAIGIARDEFDAASIRVGDRGRREQRALDLDVVHVLSVQDPGLRPARA